MKTIKILLVLFALCIGSQISAQTWAYKCVYTVKDGVKKKVTNNKIRYITFVDNKRKCYYSDENGYKESGFTYDYIGTENGIHIYSNAREVSGGYRNLESFADKMYFSSDFRRINMDALQKVQGISVYEYVENPLKEQAPKQLY